MADHDPSGQNNNPRIKNTPKHSPPSNFYPAAPLCTLILDTFCARLGWMGEYYAVEVSYEH